MAIINIKPDFFNNDAQANFDFSTHANPGFNIMEIATSKTNILLEGIRGTGKTHILKAIREQVLNEFDQQRILPIYISLAKISEYESLDEKMFRIHLYTNIVQTTVNFIMQNIKVIHNTDRNLFIKLLNYFFIFDEDIKYRSVEEILYNVQILINNLNDELLSGNIIVVSEGSAEIGAQAGIEQFKVNGKLTEKEQLGFTINKLSHLNGSRYVVEFFRELKQILSLKYSFDVV